jgi:HSP20 family protein
MNALQYLQPIEDRSIRQLLNSGNEAPEMVWNAPVDVYESKDAYRVEVEFPGIGKENIEIHYEDDVLSVSAKRDTPDIAEGVREWKKERRTGKFYRSFKLVKDINDEHISANYQDGILTVTLPKSEKVKPKQIPIT